MVERLYHYDQDRVDIFKIGNKDDLKEKLSKGVYRFVVEKSPMSIERYFIRMNEFVLPSRLYGKLEAHGKHIITSFLRCQASLGVLLYGTGGTGKSLLAKYIAKELNDREAIPTIMIPAEGIFELEYLVTNLDQPVVIIIDEFEKMFKEPEDQSHLLTLLDGMYRNNLLFILTVNEVKRINPYLLNRPSRIRYALAYNGIDDEVADEVLNDLLIDKSKAKDIKLVIQTSGITSIDVLKEFIDEVNQNPDEEVETLAKIFNVCYSTATLSDVGFQPGHDLTRLLSKACTDICERLKEDFGLSVSISISFSKKKLYRHGSSSASDIPLTDCIKSSGITLLSDGMTFTLFDIITLIENKYRFNDIGYPLTGAYFDRSSNGKFFFKQDLTQIKHELCNMFLEIFRDGYIVNMVSRQIRSEIAPDDDEEAEARNRIYKLIDTYLNEFIATLESKTVTFALEINKSSDDRVKNAGKYTVDIARQ